MSDRIRPDWADIQTACEYLHKQCNFHYTGTPDCVVGLTRGGLIPGTMISHLFDIPLIPVSYTSAVGNGSKTMYAKEDLRPINIEPSNGPLFVFLIDEICDSGHTLNEVSDYYRSLGYTVVTGVIHHKLEALHTPTFNWRTVAKTDPWVVYPWEVE